MKFSTFAAVSALALSAFGTAHALTITPAVEYTGSSSLNDNRPFTLGFKFTLSAPTAVTALGYWAPGSAGSHQVGIWDNSGNLLTSTAVSGTDLLVGHFVWKAISSLTLGAGTYTIGGEYSGGPFQSYATGVTTISQLSWVTAEQKYGTGLNFPTNSYNGYGQNGIMNVDFSTGPSAVPEPASWALMLIGVGGLGGALRARRKTVAA
jgi:hypothetical protein